MNTHEQGTLYQHTRRPEWGSALYRGTTEGRARFVFTDGTARDFGERFAHLLEPLEADEVEAAASEEPAPYTTPARRGGWRSTDWTAAEDALTLAGETVPGRTEGAQQARRRKLLGSAVKRHTARAWTAEEDDAVRTSTEPLAVIAKRIARTRKAVSSRRAKLGCKRRRALWTAEDDALLRADKPVPGRSVCAQRSRRGELGIRQPNAWIPAEDALLDLGEPVPGRTSAACKQRRLSRARAAAGQ